MSNISKVMNLVCDDEDIFEDDADIIEIIDFGFPKKVHQRSNFFESLDELSFFRRFRLYKQTVLELLTLLEADLEFRNNVNNSVSPINQVLACLRFYATGSHQLAIADFSGVDRSTVSRIVRRVTHAICRLRSQIVKMPRQEIAQEQVKFYNIARFPRVIGVVDGTHIRINSPGGTDAEVFRNRKNYFSINVQVTCNADLRIIDIVARWPGSTHDATIFLNSELRRKFENNEFEGALLLGDAGYSLKDYFLIPLPQPNNDQQRKYNQSFNTTRNIVERVIGVWKRRFPCLAYGIRLKMDNILSVIVATSVLHNIARQMNEPEPPAPEDMREEELENFIDLGNIPDFLSHAENNAASVQDQLINNYFVNL